MQLTRVSLNDEDLEVLIRQVVKHFVDLVIIEALSHENEVVLTFHDELTVYYDRLVVSVLVTLMKQFEVIFFFAPLNVVEDQVGFQHF